jgi:drug/metabolite transporter (DMT)-like permease
MQPRWILLTLTCVLLLAVGQVLFKSAAGQWRIDGWSWTTMRSFLSPAMLVALLIYAIATVLWVYVLREAPLVLAYTLFSLAFIVTPILAHFVLGEPLGIRTLIGGAVIVAGVVIAVS